MEVIPSDKQKTHSKKRLTNELTQDELRLKVNKKRRRVQGCNLMQNKINAIFGISVNANKIYFINKLFNEFLCNSILLPPKIRLLNE